MNTTATGQVEHATTDDRRALVATGLVRHYRSRAETIRAVDDVSLTLRPGELSVLAGRSGSGKSTLLNLLLGWDVPDQGTVDTPDSESIGWSNMAVVPQGLGLLHELTARQNIDVAARLARRRPDRNDGFTVDALVDRLELGDLQRRRPAHLSLGEQQRVAVARALACRPLILLADEPTAHQDEPRTRLVMGLFRELAQNGSAVLVATHDDIVLAQGDCRFDIDDGRLVPPPTD